jgi:hypothetical protein
MARPDFLVIGAQRAGTTWLDGHLRAHPDIYLPEKRKEIHFFDRYYERGILWYESFFPKGEEAARYRLFGEITPKYLFDPEVPARIATVLPDCKLIAILRNPVDRAYSQYALAVRDEGESRSFLSFAIANPDVIQRGLYAAQLRRYFDRFPGERILVLFFEEVMAAPGKALLTVAQFLDIDGQPLEEAPSVEKVNAAYRPKYPRIRAAVRRVGVFLREHDLDWFVNVAKELGLPHMFGNTGSLPPLTVDMRHRLAEEFEKDIVDLEALLGKDLSHWRARQHAPAQEAPA